MSVTCIECSAPDPDVLDVLPDQRRRNSCNRCGIVWAGSQVKPKPLDTYAAAKATFPGVDKIDSERLARVGELKADFLTRHPQPQPEVAPFWTRYQKVFSQAGLPHADPDDFHYFANCETGARPGNMSVFNLEWSAIGAEEGARRVRDSVDYLLYGPDHIPLEDRLTRLLERGTLIGMKGWKESPLTKTLCVMYPDRFLPILTYSSPNGGKKELAHQVWGLELPDANKVTWTLGRLILWSNDVLLVLAGEGFVHMQHASQFLWMAKDREDELSG